MKNANIIFLFIVCFVATSHAQWVCHDIVPDSNRNGYDSLDIDMNNDFVPDYRILLNTGFPIPYVLLLGNHVGLSNSVLTDAQGSAAALDLNTTIGPSSTTWTPMNGPNLSMAFNSFPATGAWANAIDKYLGLKVMVGSNTYYGWARITVGADNSFITLKDCGYNSQAGQSIPAGQACAPLSGASFYLDNRSCSGFTTSVTANTGTLSASGFTWSSAPPGAVFSSPSSSATTITFTSTNNYMITLSATSGSSVLTASHPTTIYPIPTVSAFATPSVFCAYNFSTPCTLTAGGATTYTFVEMPFGTPVGYGQQAVINASGISTTYMIIGESNGCTNWDTASVYGLGLPFFSVNITSSVCAGSTATLIGSVPAFTYSLQTTNGTTAFSSHSVVVTPTIFPTTYTVIASNGGCTDTRSATVQQKTITVKAITPRTLICENEPAVLSASGATTYTWLPSDLVTNSAGSSATVMPLTSTVFTVVGKQTTCVDTTFLTLTVDQCLGLSDPTFPVKEWRLFPNPASNYIAVEGGADNHIPSEAWIEDLQGRVVASVQVWYHSEPIEVNGLQPGLYFLKFKAAATTTYLIFAKL
jgi:hypothetical protein